MKIQILMSTFNGADYIRAQMDSIIAQNVENKTLLIRDDGSKDGTIAIIKEYQKRYSWISFYQGKNVGVQRSFFDLICKADEESDFFAFSDQDDEWLPGKLERAVMCIKQTVTERKCPEECLICGLFESGNEKIGIPCLYCGDKYIVDINLKPILKTVSRKVRKLSFGNALVQDMCTGCTAVINKDLLKLIKQNLPTEIKNVIMHDWWLYLSASYFGIVIYDKRPFINYRQHGKNVSGAMISWSELLGYRLRQLKSPRGQIFCQAEMFEKTYCTIACQPHDVNLKDNKEYKCRCKKFEQLKKLVRAKKSIRRRIMLCLDQKIYRQKYSDDLVFRIIVLLGKL